MTIVVRDPDIGVFTWELTPEIGAIIDTAVEDARQISGDRLAQIVEEEFRGYVQSNIGVLLLILIGSLRSGDHFILLSDVIRDGLATTVIRCQNILET